jgi:hypothetical protein
MQYVVTEYTGAGTSENPYRPLGVEQGMKWAAIDFRPDCTKLDGFCIVAFPDDATLPKNAQVLSTYKTDLISHSTKTAFSNKISINIDSRTFDELLLELLTTHSTPPKDKTRWNPISLTVDKRFEIWLGEKIVDIPVVGGGATYTESFNKADSSTLGPDLTWNEIVGNQQVKSNALHVVTSFGETRSRAEHDCSSNDNYAEATYNGLTTANVPKYGILCRYQSGADTAYMAEIIANSAATALYKLVTGTFTSLTTGTHTLAAELIKVQANGTTISMYFAGSGSSHLSVTDSSITTGTRGGLRLYGDVTSYDATFDGFTLSDIAVSATTSPSTISRSFAINTPTFPATVVPSVISRSFDINSPSVLASSTIAPSTIARSFTIGSPTLDVVNYATPATIALAPSILTPTVTGDSVVAAGGSDTETQFTSKPKHGSSIGKTKT